MVLSKPSEKNIQTGHEVALELLSLLSSKFVASDGSPHAATILCAAAWLTGMSLYQSVQCQQNSPSGTSVRSQDVNREWENLVYLLETYNLQRADIPIGQVVLAAMGRPQSFRPRAEMPDVQRELEEPYNTVIKKHGLDDREGARVGILLCSMLIQQYSRDGMIATDAATGVVAQGIFEAARQGSLP
jgi:hypothetical protein